MNEKNTNRKFLIRRIVVAAILVSLFGSLLVVALSDRPVTITTVATVSFGDSLWSLSENYIDESVDPREWVYQVIKLNNLESANIFPGQELIVPVWE